MRNIAAWPQATNHRRRIIQTTLLAEYAYLLAVGGMLYTITDVQVHTDAIVRCGVIWYLRVLLSLSPAAALQPGAKQQSKHAYASAQKLEVCIDFIYAHHHICTNMRARSSQLTTPCV